MRVALIGLPNCGKTALFNRLTGSRQKVANYPGVTVERKEGVFSDAKGERHQLLDLPGLYSFKPTTLDEAITRVIHLDREAEEATGEIVEYRGTYSQYLVSRELDEERLSKMAERQQSEIKRLSTLADSMRGQTATRARP